jgi:hypothetical protein
MADTDADGGRGLALAAAVADDWGSQDPTGPGKTVWAQTGPTGGHPDLVSPDAGITHRRRHLAYYAVIRLVCGQNPDFDQPRP